MQILKTIDGKIHHLKELDFIERQLADLFSPETFYQDLAKFLQERKEINFRKNFMSFKEMETIDKWVKEYFYNQIPEANTWLIRAYIVGRLLEASDRTASVFQLPEVVSLPKSIIEAAKTYNLTKVELNALTEAMENAGLNISNTTTNTIQKVRQAVTEAIQQHEGWTGVERRLKDLITEDKGELNRDWKRVAIYETNAAFSNAYLCTLKDGDWVRGISMPDACEVCYDLIHNKIYQVTKNSPPGYDDSVNEDEYKKISKDWETKIWAGKSNIGRSSSSKKRIDKEIGNKKSNLKDRQHHEKSMPVIPMHPHCRCRWIKFNPKFEWIDKDGRLRLSIEDPEAHRVFYENLMSEAR
ncbi:MAG: hypothetical protein ACM34K_01295 [Bacillota bacterium]